MPSPFFRQNVKRKSLKVNTLAIHGGLIIALFVILSLLGSLQSEHITPSGLSSPILSWPQQQQQHQKNYNGTIVVQLSGEMGNNLHKLAFAKALQWMGEDLHGIRLNLVLRHQDHSKWLSAKKNLQECFPSLRELNFKAGNGPHYTERLLEQKLLLGGEDSNTLEVQGSSESNMTSVLHHLNHILQTKRIQQSSSTSSSVDTIHVPFILANQMVGWHTLDKYREKLIDWLVFDDDTCCPSDLPHPEESVFHFRNFLTELQAVTTSLGFEELSPERTAQDLFGHLRRGDKVAITTRFDNDLTQHYVQAMVNKGLQVRVMAGHSTTQDFCFMTKARKELVGGQRSSFFAWAAYLGIVDNKGMVDADGNSGGIQKVRSYSVLSSTFATASKSIHGMRLPYEWTNPVLKEKWEFKVYQSENRIPTKINW